MRFMVLIKANKDTEAGVMPSERLLAEMILRPIRARPRRECRPHLNRRIT